MSRASGGAFSASTPALVMQFERLAGAPGAVVRLRELILALAVQGKLVPQEESDGSAAVLLERSRSQVRTKMEEGKTKKEKPAAAVDTAETPFAIPDTWQWCRLTDTGEFINGLAFKPTDWAPHGLPIIRIQNLSGRNQEFNRTRGSFHPSVIVRSGDILVSWSATLDAFIWQGETGVLNQHIFRVEPAPCVDRGFLYWLLKWAIRDLAESEHAHGLVMSHINRGPFLAKPIALPPIAEQARIVARVDELMRLCDALEAKGRLEAEQHTRLLDTLLGTLTDSATPEELAANWQRVAEHFDLLLDRPEAVDALEQTILQLAVRGLLVHQDPNDEPADDFLERLRDERLRLHEERRGKNDVRWSPVESGLYELPSGWTWTTIEQLAEVGTGTTPSRDNAAFFTGGTIPWVTSGETGQPFIRETAQHVTEVALAKTSLTVYPVGTLIVAMYGQGKTRGQVSELCLPATTNQACAAIVLMERSAVHRDFIKLVFEKSYDEIRELSAGGAQPNLNVGKVKTSLIPLPPLKEQARIVTRVSELRRLCADLRQRLAASQATQSRLAEALVDQVA